MSVKAGWTHLAPLKHKDLVRENFTHFFPE